jgi:hypothetical protein
MVQGQGISGRAVMLVGWATALLMVVTLATDVVRRAVRTWPVLAGLGVCCGAIGAVAWDGCRELSYSEMREEIRNGVNPEFAISHSGAETLKTIEVLRKSAGAGSALTTSLMARKVLDLIHEGSR